MPRYVVSRHYSTEVEADDIVDAHTLANDLPLSEFNLDVLGAEKLDS